MTEVDGPDAVGYLLEPDGVVVECIAEEQQPVSEAERPRRGDFPDREMPGVLDRRQRVGVRPRRRPVARSLTFTATEGAPGIRLIADVFVSCLTDRRRCSGAPQLTFRR